MFKKRLISYLFIFLLNVPALIALSTCFDDSNFAYAVRTLPSPSPSPIRSECETGCSLAVAYNTCNTMVCPSDKICKPLLRGNLGGVCCCPTPSPSPQPCTCSSPTGAENDKACSGNVVVICKKNTPSNPNSTCGWTNDGQLVCLSTQYQKCYQGNCVTCNCGGGFTPGQKRCSSNGTSIETCNFSQGNAGSPPTCSISTSTCDVGKACQLVGGAPTCTPTPCNMICNPGDQQCTGANSYKTCSANGCSWSNSQCNPTNYICKTVSQTQISCGLLCDMCMDGSTSYNNGDLRCNGLYGSYTVEKCDTTTPTCSFVKVKDCGVGQQCLNGQCKDVCGDYTVSGTEQCDDGNAVSGDGCSSTCKKESCNQITDLSKCGRGSSDCGTRLSCIKAKIGGIDVCTCERDCETGGILSSSSCSEIGVCNYGGACRYDSVNRKCGCTSSPAPYRIKDLKNSKDNFEIDGQKSSQNKKPKIKKCESFKLKLEKDELGKIISPDQNICLNGGVCEEDDEICGVVSEEDLQTREETYKCGCQKVCEKLSPPNCEDGYAFPKTCGGVDDPENPGLKKCGIIEDQSLKLDAVDSIGSDEAPEE